jgi:hypothetical protein
MLKLNRNMQRLDTQQHFYFVTSWVTDYLGIAEPYMRMGGATDFTDSQLVDWSCKGFMVLALLGLHPDVDSKLSFASCEAADSFSWHRDVRHCRSYDRGCWVSKQPLMIAAAPLNIASLASSLQPCGIMAEQDESTVEDTSCFFLALCFFSWFSISDLKL